MAADSRDDGHAHDHTAGANSRQLTYALGLTGTFLVAEIAGGLYFNSLALLSDAAHMFTDAAALAIALIAIRIGQKAADDKRTFG
ncbi:cation transporter, partial [Acinetobacter johnsonii]